MSSRIVSSRALFGLWKQGLFVLYGVAGAGALVQVLNGDPLGWLGVWSVPLVGLAAVATTAILFAAAVQMGREHRREVRQARQVARERAQVLQTVLLDEREEGHIRAEAALALGRLREGAPERARVALAALAASATDEQVRQAAHIGLIMACGRDISYGPALGALDHPDPARRTAAIQVVAGVHDLRRPATWTQTWAPSTSGVCSAPATTSGFVSPAARDADTIVLAAHQVRAGLDVLGMESADLLATERPSADVSPGQWTGGGSWAR
jgi:hypothetical protein